MEQTRAPLKLLACEAADPFARAVARSLGLGLVEREQTWFSCGEGKLVIEDNVRGCDVYVLQSVTGSGERSLYERFVMLLHAVEAAALSDAESVTAVLPYFPGARQDKRKGRTREGISAGLFARALQVAGAQRVIAVEIHNEAIGGMFDPGRCQLDNVYLTRHMAAWLKERGLSGTMVVSPDVGGLERARRYAEELHLGLAALSKERDYRHASTVRRVSLIGEVTGEDVLLIDDIIDTAGSVCAAIRELKHHGARNVFVVCAHPVLSGPAWTRLTAERARAEEEGWRLEVVGTTSVHHEPTPDWYHEFHIEPLVASVIRNINCRGSVTRAQEDRP